MTNATWNDIWLNEGFTVYFETRIDEELYGARLHRRCSSGSGRQDLRSRDRRPSTERDTWLELDLAGRDPDDGPDLVPYEKGSLFLRTIEQAVGRERFDAFLADYFDRFAFHSMDTATFLAHLRAELLEPAGVSDADLQLEAWVHGPGIPANAPDFASDAFDRVDGQAAALLAGRPAGDLDTAGWVPQQWVHFLRALPADVPHPLLADLDRTFGFSEQRQHRGRHGVAGARDRLGLRLEWRARSTRAVAAFLARHGRSLYLRRVYAKLAATPIAVSPGRVRSSPRRRPATTRWHGLRLPGCSTRPDPTTQTPYAPVHARGHLPRRTARGRGGPRPHSDEGAAAARRPTMRDLRLRPARASAL